MYDCSNVTSLCLILMNGRSTDIGHVSLQKSVEDVLETVCNYMPSTIQAEVCIYLRVYTFGDHACVCAHTHTHTLSLSIVQVLH